MRNRIGNAGLTAVISMALLAAFPVIAWAAPVLPAGITAGSQSLAGMTAEEAKAAVQEYVDGLAAQSVTLSVDGQDVATTAGELGFHWINTDAIDEAVSQYAGGSLIKQYMIEKDLAAAEDVTQEQIHEDIKNYVFDTVLPAEMVDENTKFFINPTGRFVIGGPHGDSGLTGRKIIVDTYGGMARHGGGAFSGKDCTKVDRSAAYAARYVAKNIVAAGLAKKCEIQLSYAIGVAHPTSIMVDTFGTGKVSDEKLVEIIRKNFDLRPAGIIKMLDLRRPIYKQTAAYGHFGRTDIDLSWEKTDKVDVLKAYL